MATHQEKPPFYLVTGFLGSGKTTFMNHFLGAFKNKKMGVIQNEFAPGNVDGEVLRQDAANFRILEVNRGSVFCVCLLGDFIESLSEFIDQIGPDMIILESSGLADPVNIAEMLGSPRLRDKTYLAHIWCIVDALNFKKISGMNKRVEHQLMVADTIVLNKIDTMPEGTGKITEKLRSVNPFAAIIETSYCRLTLEEIGEGRGILPVAMRREDLKKIESGGRPEISSAVIKTNRTIKKGDLDRFINEYGPVTIRMKGFVNLNNGEKLLIQSCFGKTSTEKAGNHTGPTQLILMGTGIEQERIAKTFRALSM